MAESKAAWGIEIGQAGLKAIKLRFVEGADQVMAVAYDYVAHPKLLNQPDASPDDLIRQALDTFLSRNTIGSDLVSISLPGQNALAKFIQLPPVQQSKVAEIVKYEARQQIPFPLEEMIWDFQALGGGIEESGYLLDGEVGLFAMKRDQVQHHLKPFIERKVEVELIQIAPMALYNFLCYDRLGYRNGQPRETSDEYSVVVDMGSDATTLIITNGKKIWIRNMPVGGNHFTRALTKEMKLTFAKAEHLKCNATKSPDPRAVFQALRPVFNDYVAEIQRSIGFFSSVNRSAKITQLVGVGNGFRLAGLQKFLQQNLQYDVQRVDTFQAVVGDSVLNAPLFQENLLTFCVPYGLALQCLKLTDIHTSLLPPEIVVERKIRRKKPWAVATAAMLLVGLSASAAGFGNVLGSVSTQRFGTAETKATEIDTFKKDLEGKYKKAKDSYGKLQETGQKLVTPLESREYWLELYKAINDCLPRDLDNNRDEKEISKMNRISIRSVTTERKEDLGAWFSDKDMSTDQVRDYMREDKPAAAGDAKEGAAPVKEDPKDRPATASIPGYEVNDRSTPPSGPGYVVTLTGVHYHHEDDFFRRGNEYIKATLLKNLQDWVVTVNSDTGGDATITPVRLIGITHATILAGVEDTVVPTSDRPAGAPVGGAAGGGGFRRGQGGAQPVRPNFPNQPNPEDLAKKPNPLNRTTFKVVFAWKPTPVAARKVWPPPAMPAGEAAAEVK